MKKRRKAFKTSPSVRIPRAAVERLQKSKAQAQAQAKQILRLRASLSSADKHALDQIQRLKASVAAAAHDNAIYVEALRDLLSFFDKVSGHTGSGGNWTVAEVKRIEEIRLLSLGV